MTDYTELTLDEYQEAAAQFAIYPESVKTTYPLIGLVGEVGEFANKYKKTLRDGTEFEFNDMVSELGDIFWYLSQLCNDVRISLDYIATENLNKLHDRKKRNVIGGSGDKR